MRKIESYGSASGVEFVQQTRNLLRRCVYRDVGVKSRIEQIVARLSAKTEAADDAERALAAANERVRALQSEVDQLETSLANRRAFAMNAVESRHAFARALAASAPMLRRDAVVDETELVRTILTQRADIFAARTREMLAARTAALALAIPARAVEPKPLAAKPSTDAASALARFADDADVAAIVRERDEARAAATRAATATKTCAERMVRYLDAKNKGYLNAKKAEMRAAVDAKEARGDFESDNNRSFWRPFVRSLGDGRFEWAPWNGNQNRTIILHFRGDEAVISWRSANRSRFIGRVVAWASPRSVAVAPMAGNSGPVRSF